MIPKTNLDDRTFDDIVNEAIRLIPRYCPEWTNHNTSDPGITLVELFAWMTEMTLYRLNKVPEKTYLSLLELMGLSLIAPQSSRAIIQFLPVEGIRRAVTVKAGTQIAPVNCNSAGLVFETEKDISINGCRLVSCVNRCGELWTDFSDERGVVSFDLFDARNKVDHVLYIASPAFKYLVSEHTVQLSFSTSHEISSVSEEIINHLFWEYWDGRTWTHIPSALSINGVSHKDNTLYISGPAEITPCTVNGREDYYLRAVLTDVPQNPSVLTIEGITVKTFFGGTGFIPDMCLSCSDMLYTPIDMNNEFRMYSEAPAFNEIFYIGADEIFKNKGVRVKVSFIFSEVYVRGEENENALFSFEYWNGSSWSKLAEDSPGFVDGTFGFKQSGVVAFKVPEAMNPVSVNNEEHFWIRVRLLTRDFSVGGQYVRDDKGNWLWKFSSKVHSPILNKIRITYEAEKQPPLAVFSDSNFQWHDLSLLCNEPAEDERIAVRLFSIEKHTLPSVYLGFSQAFPGGDMGIYFKVDETLCSKPKEKRTSFFNTGIFDPKEERRQVDILWEYWDGQDWSVLPVTDMTDSFHESGFAEFVTPPAMSAAELFGKKLFWLRVCHVSGSFESRPRIETILLNAVYARNEKTYRNEILGSGTGAPGQSYTTAHPALLPNLCLYVDEGSIPSANELELMKKDGITNPYYEEADKVWVLYKEVENFYASTPFSRHYVVDYKNNTIFFGDGQRGVIPPRGKFNIRLAEYRSGGGTQGNIAANVLQVIVQNIPFIAGCNNPFAAEGGADIESVDSLKSRAAGVFKSLQRAVTAEDFQWLAREASASVGRSFCLKEKNRQGQIRIVVIPVLPSGSDYAYQLIPSRELVRRVTAYLDDRKLVGTPICVHGPVYRSFDISLSLVFKSDVLDIERLKRTIETSLRKFFHPLEGSVGSGWEFGKDVTTGAVLKQLEKINGILSVDGLELYDCDAGVFTDKIVLKDDELPYLVRIRLENRKSVV